MAAGAEGASLDLSKRGNGVTLFQHHLAPSHGSSFFILTAALSGQRHSPRLTEKELGQGPSWPHLTPADRLQSLAMELVLGESCLCCGRLGAKRGDMRGLKLLVRVGTSLTVLWLGPPMPGVRV